MLNSDSDDNTATKCEHNRTPNTDFDENASITATSTSRQPDLNPSNDHAILHWPPQEVAQKHQQHDKEHPITKLTSSQQAMQQSQPSPLQLNWLPSVAEQPQSSHPHKRFAKKNKTAPPQERHCCVFGSSSFTSTPRQTPSTDQPDKWLTYRKQLICQSLQ